MFRINNNIFVEGGVFWDIKPYPLKKKTSLCDLYIHLAMQKDVRKHMHAHTSVIEKDLKTTDRFQVFVMSNNQFNNEF